MTFAYLISDRTVPAFPLGQPVDGRERFGMTPEQACLYRWLVAHKPHDKPFVVNCRVIAPLFLVSAHSQIHDRLMALCERGWLMREDAGYRFVHPVMTFLEPRG